MDEIIQEIQVIMRNKDTDESWEDTGVWEKIKELENIYFDKNTSEKDKHILYEFSDWLYGVTDKHLGLDI